MDAVPLYEEVDLFLLDLEVQAQLLLFQIDLLRMRLRRRRQLDRRRRRRWWVRPWLLRRPQLGHYNRLMQELRDEDVAGFQNYVRMPPALFLEIAERIHGRIAKRDTNYRKALSPGLKLAITLRYLASGASYKTLQYSFRVAHNTIASLIPEVCEAIIAEFGEEVLSCPTTPDGWREVAEQFNRKWQFPHAIGALDGKHISIRCPPATGSIYYNYKGFFSIVLMALVDADYKFLFVDSGCNGSSSDGGTFKTCPLGVAMQDGTVGLPEHDALPNDDQPIPYYIIADDAFALNTWLMKPFSHRQLTREERIFNYRLSRARRVVENAFGILSNRWRCMLTVMPQTPERVTTISIACCVLHNLIRLRFPAAQNEVLDAEDEDHNLIPGAWRQDQNLPDVGDINRERNPGRAAKNLRCYLKTYLNSPAGSVPWQQDMV